MKRIFIITLIFSLSFVENSCITKQIVSALSDEEQKLQLQQDEKKIGKEFVVRLHRSAPYQSPQQFQAGAAEIDITPWAGISMGGFGPLAKDARGFGLRLYAKAFYFEDPNGGALAMVTTDLWSMPAGLADSVAALVANDPTTAHLGRERLLFAATHTHQSPGSFSSSVQYNTFASNWHFFDPQLFHFLVLRIAQSIKLAYNRREPAHISFAETEAKNITRNRSMRALRNDSAAEISHLLSAKNDLLYDPNTPGEFDDTDCYRAVDPVLSLLVISSARTSNILGIAAFFACHPISMGANPPVYSSDFFGYAVQKIKTNLPEGSVVGFFNGAEGDVTANYYREDWKDCVRLGKKLAGEISKCLALAHPLSSSDVSSHFEIFPLAQKCIGTECTADVAELGASGLGGSEEGRTHDFVAKLKDPSGCFEYDSGKGAISTVAGQPPKIPALSKLSTLQKIVMKMVTPYVPRDVPLGICRIGDLVIVALPGEYSTLLGEHLKKALAATPLCSGKHVLFAGLGNEYLSYFTTPEEYDRQQYEGASMLYGRSAGDILTKGITQAAARFSDSSQMPDHRTYNPGLIKSIASDHLSSEADPEKELGSFLNPDQRFARVDWDDSMLLIPTDTAIRNINPEISFSVEGKESRPEDILTFVSKADGSGSKWSGIWLIPYELKLSPTALISVRIKTLTGKERAVATSISVVR